MERHQPARLELEPFEIIGTVRYIDGFHEFEGNGFTQHWVDATWRFDIQASYDFTGLVPVESKPVPGYSKETRRTSHTAKNPVIKETAPAQTANYGVSAWRRFLCDGTIITVGCNNVFDPDPPADSG